MLTISDLRNLRWLQACIVMTAGLCFHFFGYECTRAASIALLAAKENGMGNEALPLTIALGSPAGGLVLYLYTKSIKTYGSRVTLRVSGLLCLLILAIITFYCKKLNGLSGQITIISFYIFREIYVSLLSTQQWAFISGSLNKATSSYLVIFTGIVSVASALGGCAIEQLVNYGGVKFLLITSLIVSLLSFLCCELSHYLVAGFDMSFNSKRNASRDNLKLESERIEQTTIRIKNGILKSPKKTILGSTFLFDSYNLMAKHRLLQLLFAEAITHQMCTTMLNLMFHNGLRQEVSENSMRAMLVGRFFATVNIAACALQCFVIPYILSQSSLSMVLTKIPFIVFAVVVFGVIKPGLISVFLGFGTIKVLEYSIMTAASEMVYMPATPEVRYLGKELIKFFGHKLGRSAASLILSYLISIFNPSITIQSFWGCIFIFIWGLSMLKLANYLTNRDKALEKTEDKLSSEEIYSNVINFNEVDVKRIKLTNSNNSVRIMNPITKKNCVHDNSESSSNSSNSNSNGYSHRNSDDPNSADRDSRLTNRTKSHSGNTDTEGKSPINSQYTNHVTINETISRTYYEDSSRTSDDSFETCCSEKNDNGLPIVTSGTDSRDLIIDNNNNSSIDTNMNFFVTSDDLIDTEETITMQEDSDDNSVDHIIKNNQNYSENGLRNRTNLTKYRYDTKPRSMVLMVGSNPNGSMNNLDKCPRYEPKEI